MKSERAKMRNLYVSGAFSDEAIGNQESSTKNQSEEEHAYTGFTRNLKNGVITGH
jgi:hypothetical protein